MSSDDDILPPLPRGPGPQARALAAVLLAYTLLGVAVVTLAPFRFRAPQSVEIAWAGSGFEVAANCALLFVPGFLLRATTGANGDRYCIAPALLGAGAATAIECAQLAVPGRCFSPVDVAANASSAWFGAMTYDSIRRRVDRPIAHRLLLELPLTGLIYLLTPLLWLGAFASVGHDRRIALCLPLGFVGAVVIASLWKHRLRPSGVLTPLGASLAAACWFAVAAAPALRHDPDELGLLAVAVYCAARSAIAWPGFLAAEGQRFESSTLRRVAPLFLGYLVVLALWPFSILGGAADGSWTADWSPFAQGHPPEIVEIARLLEWMAAFTLAGYMAAERLGRTERWAARRLLRAGAPLVALAAALEGVRGFDPALGATGVRVVCAALGSVFGAAVYGLQLDAVRAWLAEREARDGSRAKAESDAAALGLGDLGDLGGLGEAEPVPVRRSPSFSRPAFASDEYAEEPDEVSEDAAAATPADASTVATSPI